MNEEVKKAREFYRKVSEESQRFQQAIPDKQLGEKLRRAGDAGTEIVKHIEERSNSQKG
jgi:hypothetical protein